MQNNRETYAKEFLRQCAEHFEPALNMRKIRWKGNGYHSHYPEGEWACPTRENLDYALALFDEGSPESCQRAETIVKAVLELQDLNPVSETYGIWPWLREESLEQMAPPDWNWADFCGVRLAHMLGLYSERVSAPLSEAIKTALNAAAYSIFRRNVGPGYTNIAVKGALVCAQAGRLLNIPFFITYAQKRLERFVAFTQQHGGFLEYNSPTYGMLVVLEIERGLMLINDPTIRRLLLQVHRLYWEQAVKSIHLSLGQICGPHSRAYSDLLSPITTRLINERLEVNLPFHGGDSDEKLGADYLLVPVPCPQGIQEDLLRAPTTSFIRCTYIHSEEFDQQRESSIWKSPDACLGSINYDNLWTQRRPVLAYWRTAEDVAVLRVRLMHDGKDFASGLIRTVQEQNELLSLVTLVTDKGDFHDHLDLVGSAPFEMANFELRIELTAPDAQALSQQEDSVWALKAGSFQALVQPAFASLSGHTIHWEGWNQNGQAGLSAQINKQQALKLCIPNLQEAAFGFYIQLREGDSQPVMLNTQQKDDVICISAQGGVCPLSLSGPLKPQPYQKPIRTV